MNGGTVKASSDLSVKAPRGEPTARNERSKLRKQPTRSRGHRRVEDLLKAASDVFVDKGFEAATMTEIAAQAGASIGSLYQFFPTKRAIADTLRAASGDFICREWDRLRTTGDDETPEQLAAAFFDIGYKMLEEFPALVPLLYTRGEQGEHMAQVRERMQRSLSDLLQDRMPDISKAEIEAASIIIREIMRCQVDIEALRLPAQRRRALSDLQTLLALYLTSKRQAASSNS